LAGESMKCVRGGLAATVVFRREMVTNADVLYRTDVTED